MRLASVVAGGTSRFGAMVDGGLVDLGARLGGRCIDLVGLLEHDLVSEAAQLVAGAKPDFALDQVSYLPPNQRHGARMFALGVAYKDHQLETGRADASLPSMFIKLPGALVGHGHPIVRPRASTMYDFEGEIVIVMGKAGRHIPEANALEYVAGYSIMMDGSIRDYQQHSVTAGKNFDRSSSYGPWITTRDEIADWRAVTVTTRLNGEQMQESAWGMLMWSVPFVIHYISTYTRLEPGDAISTGTPAGVGFRRKPPVFMKAGDVLEVAVSGVGTLRNTVVDE
jgi:2-keto-4-pentenoate hydratase/2-oxohepta-3-ene-1,7-dioic acid hydratase in catechol pathway